MTKVSKQKAYSPLTSKTVTVMSNTNPASTIDEYERDSSVDHQVLSCGHERDLNGYRPVGTLTLCHEEHDCEVTR